MKPVMNELRRLPSVDRLLQESDILEIIRLTGRNVVVDAIRDELQEIRFELEEGKELIDTKEIIRRTKSRIANYFKPTLRQVINATGVILHTNLGRAPLGADVIRAIDDVSSSYSTLEYDLKKGERGHRSDHTELLLQRITGAEGALVVNNNAAAVLLVLMVLARRRRVIISRTQLIEIGGGFRIPEILEQSGAKLVSIGSTNRVHLSDYENALSEPSALVLWAHQSNFRIIGFSAEPSIGEISELTHQAGLPLVIDQGSGALLDTSLFGLGHEPTVQELLQAGADLVCFSGDKLLGGPQAGIIVGRQVLLEKIKRHPLARALRADKICLAGLSATLLHYLKGDAVEYIPVWRMISMKPTLLKKRVTHWIKVLGEGKVIEGNSMIGGGSLPGENLPTFLLCLKISQANAFLEKLRNLPLPIIARVEQDSVLFDPRTVLPEQEEIFLEEFKSSIFKGK